MSDLTTDDLRKILLDHGHRIIEALKKEKALARFQPDDEEKTRDKHEEEEDVERCPHGHTYSLLDFTHASGCEDCQEALAELQASEAVGK